MRRLLRVPETEPTEIDKQVCAPSANLPRVPRINGERITFGDLARFACPYKTDAWLAHVLKCDVGTAGRWLRDKNEPPAEAFGLIMYEIMRRFHMRGE